MSQAREGWGLPGQSNKYHYFIGSRSLCGKWGFYQGEVSSGHDNDPHNCVECKRRLSKRREK